MFKSTQLCGNPSRNCLPQLELDDFHIFFHNLRQIFRELRLRAREEVHFCHGVSGKENGVCSGVQLDICLSKLPSPTPTIAVMGDMNFPKQSLAWSRSDGDTSGDLVPLVAAHRDGETVGGKQDRLQAAKLCDLATKHSLLQQVDQPTHGVEILDLIFSNNPDLISSVSVDAWPSFTDHKLVTAFTSFQLCSDPH